MGLCHLKNGSFVFDLRGSKTTPSAGAADKNVGFVESYYLLKVGNDDRAIGLTAISWRAEDGMLTAYEISFLDRRVRENGELKDSIALEGLDHTKLGKNLQTGEIDKQIFAVARCGAFNNSLRR
jgi:hypothetical protein